MDKFTALWTLLAVVLAVVEASTAGLVCIWFCISAVVAALVSLITKSLLIQLVTFIVVSIVLLATTRDLVKKFIDSKKVPTNADAIIGCTGIVIIDIDPVENTGQIKVNGQVWSAKAEKEISAGTNVKVTALSGVKAVVSEI